MDDLQCTLYFWSNFQYRHGHGLAGLMGQTKSVLVQENQGIFSPQTFSNAELSPDSCWWKQKSLGVMEGGGGTMSNATLSPPE